MILEDIAAAPQPRRNVNLGGRVEVELILHQDAAFVRFRKARQAVQRQRLSRSAWTKQNGYAGRGLQVDVELKRFGVQSSGVSLDNARVNVGRTSGGGVG